VKCEYTVIITRACAVATTLTSLMIAIYIVTIVIVLLYYCLCCNAGMVTHVWLEPILYRQSDACGSPWTIHSYKCMA